MMCTWFKRVSLACLLGVPAIARAGPEPACSPVSAGLDSSFRDTQVDAFFGRAVGQTFFAEDTIITRLTVWRPPGDIDAVGTHLSITTVDTQQVPAHPVTQGIVLDGPTVFVRDEPPGELIRMDFVIDPPLVLRNRGTYAFFLQREGCNIGDTYVVASDANPYPYGVAWLTERVTTGPCFLARVETYAEEGDICFEIEYCRDATTAVRHGTWGELKILYR